MPRIRLVRKAIGPAFALTLLDSFTFATTPANYLPTRLDYPKTALFGNSSSLSDDGIAAGYSLLPGPPQEIHAILWAPDGMPHKLPLPSGYDSAIAFNHLSDGQTVGGIRKPFESFAEAIAWQHDGSIVRLQATANRDGSIAQFGAGSIIVGNSFQRVSVDRVIDRLMVWEDYQMLAEITFSGADGVSVEGINASGTYVGFFNSRDGSIWGQFIGQRDQVRILDFSDYRGLDIAGINDFGHFVGSYTIDDFQNYMGYVSFDGESITQLPPLPGFTTSAISEINNAGEIVGIQWDNAGHEIASYYPPGSTTAIDMNTLIDPIPGVKLVRGIDINNHGQILVEGVGPTGYTYYVLTPTIPEPALAGGAILVLLAARRRRCAAA